MLRAFFAAILLMAAVGCGSKSPESAEGPLRVVATTAMIGDVVEALAGEAVELVVLMGPGVDPHLYAPTRSDVTHLERADLVLFNGFRLEGRMGDVLSRLSRRGAITVAVAERLAEEWLLEDDDEADSFDPHLWMDVARWKRVTEALRDLLMMMLPEHAPMIEERSHAYLADLAELDAYVRRVVETIPETARLLITAHDAFGYFGQAYGIEVRGIQGLSTESEAGLRDLEELVRLITDHRVPAIFLETSVADRTVQAVMDRVRARGHEVRIGGRLFSDAMGAPGTYEGTYIGMIDHNATTIVRALGGEAPPRGWRGELSDDGGG